jgi:hypothetical protein
MGVRTEGNGHGDVWKILIGLSVVCAVLVFVGGFLHRRALDAAVADRQAKSVTFVTTKVDAAAKHADLSKQLKDPESARLTKQLDLPAGTDLRLFSTAGAVLYTSPGLTTFPADAEGLQAAAAGGQAHVVDGSDLRVYAPVNGKGAKPVAIAAVVSNYLQLRNDASGPLDGVRLPLVGLGVVLLVAGLLLMLRSGKGSAGEKRAPKPADQPKAPKAKVPSGAKGRVTGFDPVPVSSPPSVQRVETEEMPDAQREPVAEDAPAIESPEPTKARFGLRLGSKKPKDEADRAPDPQESKEPKAKRALFTRKGTAAEAASPTEVAPDAAGSALDREVAIRQGLEDQLEQLRTRIQMQDVETANAKKELLAQIEAASRRADEAEARAADAGAGVVVGTVAPVEPVPAPASDETALRVKQLEREVADARSVTADAVARAETLQRQLDEAQAAPTPAPGDAAKMEEAMAQLVDAQQRVSAAEQRAASVESVRDELEVRVAQLGTKAGELEQRATELESSLNEANAGGDAVRAEIATLTAALAAANARVTELESAPLVPAAPSEEDRAEVARLRGELANQMERAQAAEERVASLEADVLAAERGVSALPVEAPPDRASQTAPDESVDERLAERFETSQPEVETHEPDQVVAHEPEVHEPEVHEPEVHEPEVHEPEVHEPVASEVEWATVQPGGVEADGSVAEAAPETLEPRGEELRPEPVNRWGSFAAATESDEVDVPSVTSSESSPLEMSAPEAVETALSSSEPSQPEQDEDGAQSESGPIADELSEPEPVEEAPVHEPAPSTPAVEWHAPVAAPETAPASPNGNGVPPAPSDDARYDDIWTAAFAPPEPQPEPAGSESQSVSDEAATEPQVSDEATPQPEALEESSATDGSDSPQAAVSADDQPSPSEDELSAEDDMWSLRARLADAAARKHTLPHETTEP